MADEGAGKKRKIKDDHAAKAKRQVMTRMMDKVSDDFVNNFADTRVDEGPEAAARNAQLQAFAQETEMARQAAEARAAREAREARENADGETQPTFKGFAALLGRKTTAEVKVGGMFARLLGDDDESQDGNASQGTDSSSTGFATVSGESPDLSVQPADGVIKTRAGGKRRGLYTSCMNKPVLGGEPHRPMSMSQDPSIAVNQKPAQDIASRVAAARQAAASGTSGAPVASTSSSSSSSSSGSSNPSSFAPGASVSSKSGLPVVPVATNNNQSGWKKIDAEPLSKLAEAARSGNNMQPAVPPNMSSEVQSESATTASGTEIPASTAKSVKDRAEAMARMLPSGAREFTLPPMPSAAELSTLRRLANDGKGTKAIPASAFEQPRQAAQEESEQQSAGAPQSHPVASGSGPIQSIFGKVCAGLSKLFGKGK